MFGQDSKPARPDGVFALLTPALFRSPICSSLRCPDPIGRSLGGCQPGRSRRTISRFLPGTGGDRGNSAFPRTDQLT